MKNLTISKTFDDFALDTANIDFDVEDLTSYCEETTSVLYWINIESIWGPIGFEWDTYENKGHFNSVPIEFTILPRVPDPHRLKTFDGIFKNISRDITILENDFENIDTICNWYTNYYSWSSTPSDKTVKIYITENTPITTIGKSSVDPGTVHVVGSLENVTTIINMPKLIMSSENVGKLKLPLFLIYNNTSFSNVNVYIKDIDGCLSGDDLTQIFKELPNDFVFTSSNQNNFLYINIQVPKIPESPTFKLYKAQLKDITCLTPFITRVTSNDSTYIGNHTYDLNGLENENYYIVVPNVLLTRGTVIKFTKEPVNNFWRFCAQNETNNIIFDHWDIVNDNDQKYNYFVNPYTEGEDNYYLVLGNALTLKNPNCYCYNDFDCNIPIKFDVNYKVYSENAKNVYFFRGNYAVDKYYDSCPQIDLRYSTSEQIREFIETNKENNLYVDIIDSTGTNLPVHYNWAFEDINYLDYEEMDQEIVDDAFANNFFNFPTFINGFLHLNDSLNKFKSVNYRALILLQDTKANKISHLYVPRDCTNKLIISDNKLKIDYLYLYTNVIPKIFDYPELKLPINDPDNYLYNYSIISGIQYNPYKNTTFGHIRGGSITDGITYVTLNQELALRTDVTLSATTKGKYGNSWSLLASRQAPIITPLSKVVAFGYALYTFAYHYFFIDEDSDSTVETAENMTKFVNKCLRNPVYKENNYKNIGKIILNSTLYALLTLEQIDGLVEYGWAIEEIKI